ncbi:MAG TPA: DUF695 domain-containing protein [Pyrinomonadaceae bacterium]|jgi:hypothetical protein
MNEENQEKWAMDEGELENGLPYTLRFREDLPDEENRKKMKTLIVVSWLFESADGNGMPPEEIEDQMDDFEDLLDEALVEKGTARLMTVFTGEGIREWQFYTDDEEFFIRKFNESMEGRPVLPLEIEAFEDENWDGYKDYTELSIPE